MNVDLLFNKRGLDDDLAESERSSKISKTLETSELRILEMLQREDDDNNTKGQVEIYDQDWLKKSLTRLDKAIEENTKMRHKYKDEAIKFLDSEFELNESIKNLSGLSLSDDTELIKSFCKSSTVLALIALMKSHPNIDVSNQIVIVLNELLESDDDDDDDDVNYNTSHFTKLFEKTKFTFLLCDHIVKLDKQITDPFTKEIVMLDLVEQLSIALDLMTKLSELSDLNKFMIDDKKLIRFVLGKLQIKSTNDVDENLQSISELMFSVVSTTAGIKISRLTKLIESYNLIEILLVNLSLFIRKKKVKEAEQQEYIENLVDCLCLLLQISPIAKTQFIDNEGLELVFLAFIKESDNSWAIGRSLKILANTINGNDEISHSIASSIIHQGGLKYTFKYLNSKHTKDVVSIIASLFRLLDLDSTERIRLFNKLLDKNGHNFIKLLKLRGTYMERIDNEEDELLQIELGLDVVQLIDVIIAWCLIDENLKLNFSTLLQPQLTKAQVKASLKQQIQDIEDVLSDPDTTTTDQNTLESFTNNNARDSVELLQILESQLESSV